MSILEYDKVDLSPFCQNFFYLVSAKFFLEDRNIT
jgi:hypothetical protein